MTRRRAAVLGMPVAHSLSPILHTTAYAALGLDWDYTAVECDESALAELLGRVRVNPGWAGLSLTMPLKTAVLALLDTLDDTAALLGAVNTIVVRPGPTGGTPARLHGFNTDVMGIAHAVTQVLGTGVAPRSPLVLGAGGTARAALGALASLGADRVDLVARRPAAAALLVDIGGALGLGVTVHRWGSPDSGILARPGGPGSLRGADIVLATTPAGVTDDLARHPWPSSTALVELLYHPWPTRLAARAQAAGAALAGGLVVLAAQAGGQVRLFTGAEVDVGLLLDAGRRALELRSASGSASGSAPAPAPTAAVGSGGGTPV
ncbi:shikimate dehydrogenase [Frankia sp. Cas4]|uniref:shikimate dehydrogenase family protein n=1 Tax=Frankia sp. Cas4 TaxID=3073927 RepID=UPI002AD328F0|nr:shikimate dehydrogenase [Frankia sp. Cas4]